MPLDRLSIYCLKIVITYFLHCFMVFHRELHDVDVKAWALAANKPDLDQGI